MVGWVKPGPQLPAASKIYYGVHFYSYTTSCMSCWLIRKSNHFVSAPCCKEPGQPRAIWRERPLRCRYSTNCSLLGIGDTTISSILRADKLLKRSCCSDFNVICSSKPGLLLTQTEQAQWRAHGILTTDIRCFCWLCAHSNLPTCAAEGWTITSIATAARCKEYVTSSTYTDCSRPLPLWDV